MPARLKLYVDWINKKLLLGPNNRGGFQLPPFFQGDVVPFQVYIVEQNPDHPSAQIVLPIDNMSLKVAFGEAPTGTAGGPSPFVTQFSWSKNLSENYFHANVALNTAGLNAWLGAAAQRVDAYLEIEITEDTGVTTAFQGIATIKAELIEAATLAVAAGETPLSLEMALQMFLKKLSDPGDTWTAVSPDGTRQRVLGVRNDGSAQDDPL